MLYIILVRDFCPLKIKITQCPGEFRLNIFMCVFNFFYMGYLISRGLLSAGL